MEDDFNKLSPRVAKRMGIKPPGENAQTEVSRTEEESKTETGQMEEEA